MNDDGWWWDCRDDQFIYLFILVIVLLIILVISRLSVRYITQSDNLTGVDSDSAISSCICMNLHNLSI